MRKLMAAVAALIALAVAGIAQSTVAEGDAPGRDRVFGGGRFVFDFDQSPEGQLVLPREFSVHAALGGGKNADTLYYANPDGANSAQATTISCVRVEGSRAVIGAINLTGSPIVVYYDDRGTPGPAPPDGITPVLVMDDADVALFMPRNFPRVCPSTTPPPEWGDVWTTLQAGDIAVVDGD